MTYSFIDFTFKREVNYNDNHRKGMQSLDPKLKDNSHDRFEYFFKPGSVPSPKVTCIKVGIPNTMHNTSFVCRSVVGLYVYIARCYKT